MEIISFLSSSFYLILKGTIRYLILQTIQPKK